MSFARSELRCGWRMVAWAIAAILGSTLSAGGQSPSAALQYRRIFVAEESLESQIRGLLPLRRTEFSRLIEEFDRRSATSGNARAPRIERIAGRARLEGNQLKLGTAEISVTLPGEPAGLSLEPLSLQIESATWLGEPGLPALLGTDRQGQLACWVERSGVLRLEFSLRASENKAGEVAFDVRLPVAPRASFEILAPREFEITSQHGLVNLSDSPPEPSGQSTWTIELGGVSQTLLSAHRTTQPAVPRARVRERSSYAISPSTLDLETTFTLDMPLHSPEETEFGASAGLKVTAIVLKTPNGEQRLAHTLTDSASGTRLTVRWPAQLANSIREVRLEATAEWPLEKPATLPRLWATNAVYEQGQTSILSPTWLRLAARPLKGCQQVGVVPDAKQRGSDEFHFQTYDADAAIEITAAQRLAALRELSGAQIQIEAHQITGTLITELSASADERFAVSADLPGAWIIDGIETEPAEMLLDRLISNHPGGQRRLLLNLAQPITADRPLRVMIRAHLRRPAGEGNLNEDYFRLANFIEAEEVRRLLDVRSVDSGFQLRPDRESPLPVISAGQLSSAELRLFESPPGNQLFLATRATAGLTADIVRATARFHTEVLVQSRHGQDRTTQSLTIDCLPEASTVNGLVVHIVPAPRGAITWRVAGEDNLGLQATAIPSAAGQGNLDETVYQLALARPRASAFQIQGEWSVERSADERVGLAYVAGSASQTSRVEIFALESSTLATSAEAAESLGLATTSATDFSILRARYRYDRGRQATIRVRHVPPIGTPAAAWIERIRMESRISLESAQHEAEITIANEGARALRLRMPAEAAEIRISRDGEQDETALLVGVHREVSVALPPGQRRTHLRLHYRSPGPRLLGECWGRIVAPLPESELPVLQREWTVFLAPALATSQGEFAADTKSEISTGSTWQCVFHGVCGPALTMNWPWASRLGTTQRPPALPHLDLAGWQRLDFTLLPHEPASLEIHRPGLIFLWGLCAGLVSLLATYHFKLPGLVLIVSAATLLAAGAVSASVAGSLLLSIALGLLAGGAISYAQRAQHDTVNSARPAAKVATSAAIIAALAMLSAPLYAQERTPTNSAPAGQLPRRVVVIGVDSKQQPVGDYVYLSPDFYDELHRRTTGPSNDSIYFLESARYELPGAVEAVAAATSIEEMRASFVLHTMQPETSIELPLLRSELSLLEGRARLDGQPVKIHWREDGGALQFQVPVSGKHRFELAAAAEAEASAEGALLRLTLPPAARSVAAFPATADPRIKVGTSLADLSAAASDFSRPVPLGQAGRMVVQWPPVRSPASRSPSLQATQLLLWSVRPDSTMVEGRFRIKNAGPRPRQVAIAFDHRLRLLPADQDVSVRVEEGQPNYVHVDLPESDQGEFELRLSWLWQDKIGMGMLALPSVEIKAQQLERAWTAVVLDPSLGLMAIEGDVARLPIADFSQAWSDVTQPAIAFQDLGKGFRPTIVVRPSESLPLATQSIDWSISSAETRAEIRLQLTDVPRTRFEYRLKLPAQSKISRVLLRESGRVVPLRWTNDSGEVVLTLLEAPSPTQELQIETLMPTDPRREPLALEGIRLGEVRPGKTFARVYRDASVQVNVRPDDAWRRQDDPELGKFRSGFGRLAAVLMADAAGHSASELTVAKLLVHCVANEPRTRGAMLIRAHEADGDWRADIDLDLSLTGGLLDEMHLAVPHEWPGPYEVDGATIEEAPAFGAETDRRLIVRPAQAAGDRMLLSIRGSLVNSSQGVRVPNVSLLNQENVQRFLLLPRRAGASRLDWRIAGVQSTGSSTESLPASWSDAEGDLARIEGPAFEAVGRVRPQNSNAGSVYFSDIQVRLERGRRYIAAAELLIQPTGASELTLTLPPGSRLIQVLVDNQIAQCLPRAIRQWRLATISKALPFRLAILYDGIAATEGSGGWRFEAPSLAGLPIHQTIWSFETEQAIAGAIPARSISSAQRALTRLEAVAAALADLATAQGGETPAVDLAEHLGSLRQIYLESAQQPIEPEGAVEHSALAQQRALLDQEFTKLEQRISLEPAKDLQRMAQRKADLLPLHALESSSYEVIDAALLLTLHEQTGSTRSSAASWNWPWIFTAGALWLGLVLYSAVGRNWVRAQSPFVIAAGGVLWWLLAPLGWLGLLFVVLGAWRSVPARWRRVSMETASVIHRYPPAPAE